MASALPSHVVLESADDLAAAAAREVCAALRAALERSSSASLVLAGGTTPARLYRRLVEVRDVAGVDWSRVEFFWGDERCVPPDHEASNYRMAREALLAPLDARAERIHRMRGELPSEEAATRYEAELAAAFGPGAPSFDLVLLGMGADGHTASLFPGSPALMERRRLVVAAESPLPPHPRVTLTLPVLNAARAVLFLVSGASKAATAARALGDVQKELLPAARIRPSAGRLLWMLDREAAALLPQEG